MPSRGRPPRGAAPSVRSGCCWYHRQDWNSVTERAVQLVEDAHRQAISGHDLLPHALDKAQRDGISHADFDALYTLLSPPLAITASTGYTNGQHRVQAMRDMKVERTVTVRWCLPDSS
ncbi:hypothetical protein GCM10020000_87170 [Streptomyces olivoverticillatus]